MTRSDIFTRACRYNSFVASRYDHWADARIFAPTDPGICTAGGLTSILHDLGWAARGRLTTHRTNRAQATLRRWPVRSQPHVAEGGDHRQAAPALGAGVRLARLAHRSNGGACVEVARNPRHRRRRRLPRERQGVYSLTKYQTMQAEAMPPCS